MNFPQIVPNTFTTTEEDTGVYRSVLNGSVCVEFGGQVYTVPAKRTVGVEIIDTYGEFMAQGKMGKAYKLSISYRPKDDEHNCQIPGLANLAKIVKVWRA